MKPRLKELSEQVIVITGASSGIGLTTARMAAKRGAKLVLFARNQEALEELCDELNGADGDGAGHAVMMAGDVADEQAVLELGLLAMQTFGRIDTWINDAGVSIYGRIERTSTEDAHRLFETNYWGLVNGSRVAVELMKNAGGAIINLGSVVSDRAMPLQGHYVASKHAVKGFTDALRMEVEHDGYPISVTLIKPAGIDTPYTEHAMNLMDKPPRNPQPLYRPEAVAQAILHAAQHPVRDRFVGSAAKGFATAEKAMPRTADRLMEKTMFAAQHSRKRRDVPAEGALWAPGRGGEQRSWRGFMARKNSMYTRASEHPVASGAVIAGAALAVLAAVGVIGAAGAKAVADSSGGGRRDWTERGGAREEMKGRWVEEPFSPAI